MSTARIHILEEEASEQRRQLQDATSQLRQKLRGARDKLSIDHNLRDRFVPVSIVASAVAFVLGYGIGGIFHSR